MIETDQPTFNPSAIEALKAATQQVIQSTPSSDQADSLTVLNPTIQTVTTSEPKQKSSSRRSTENFADAFVDKITSFERAIATLDQEQLAVEQELKLVAERQSDLVSSQTQLGNRRKDFITIKDKLTVLDKELSAVLKPASL